jgi:hypothetical protein
MTHLKKLQSMGYTLDFFKLSQLDGTFYTFDTYQASQQPGYWNIIGITQESGKELFVNLQIFYIDEEALDYKAFSAPHDAGSMLEINVEELQAFIHFFEEHFELQNVSTKDPLIHFSLIDKEDLARLHFSEKEAQRRYYYYYPTSSIQPQEKMSIVGLPSWIFNEKLYPHSTLIFATFNSSRLEDPAFHILDVEWLGSMRFDLEALSEFIFLLKQQERTVLDYLGSKRL